MKTDTKWLTPDPTDERKFEWHYFDAILEISFDEMVARFLANGYRKKLNEHFPNLSRKDANALVVAFQKHIGLHQIGITPTSIKKDEK